MASFEPCEGTGEPVVEMKFSPSRSNGLGWTQAKTFGNCPKCARVEIRIGDARYPVNSFVTRRHKYAP